MTPPFQGTALQKWASFYFHGDTHAHLVGWLGLQGLRAELGRVDDAGHDEHHNGEAEGGQQHVHADLKGRGVHVAVYARAGAGGDHGRLDAPASPRRVVLPCLHGGLVVVLVLQRDACKSTQFSSSSNRTYFHVFLQQQKQ